MGGLWVGLEIEAPSDAEDKAGVGVVAGQAGGAGKIPTEAKAEYAKLQESEASVPTN